MKNQHATWALALVCALTLSIAHAKGNRGEHDNVAPATSHGRSQTTDTITWWCVDLNVLWKVKAPVTVARGAFLGGDPSVSPYCGDPNALTDGRFPVAVPAGTPFMPSGTAFWFTNTTYLPGFAAALQAAGLGYTFNPHSNSPSEDFKAKMTNIRVEIYRADDDALVAEYSFDPQKYFKLVQLRDYYGQLPLDPIVDPSFGLSLSADQVGRLPTYGFAVMPIAPSAPGLYYEVLYWTFSDYHWDGLGIDPNVNLWAPGEFVISANLFLVP